MSRTRDEAPQFDPGEAADLRRHQRADAIAEVLARLEPLPAGERVLVESIYRDGRTAVEVAAMLQDHPRRVRRRVKQIVQRALSPRFAFVALHVAQWPAERRRIAEACVLEGRSLREAARELGISLHQARRHAQSIETLFQSARSSADAARVARDVGARALRTLVPRSRRQEAL